MKYRSWSESDIEQLRLMWPIKSFKEICEALNRTMSSVACKAYLIGLRQRKRGWSKELTDIAIQLRVVERKSAAEISEAIGKSRNSVVSRLNRLGVKAIPPTPRKLKEKKPRKLAPEVIVMRRKIRPNILVPVPDNAPVALLSREREQCSYIVGHHMCCGAPVFVRMNGLGGVKTTSWCEYHWNIVFQRKDAA